MPFGVIARPYERPAFDMVDAFGFADLFVHAERVGVDELFDGQVHLRRLEVLADGHHIDAGLGEVVHQRQHFIFRLAEADHDATLGTEALLFGNAQHIERALVDRLGPHTAIEPRYRLDVVVEDLRPFVEHDLEGIPEATEVGDEHLDGTARDLLADLANGLGEDRCTTIFTLIPVDRGDDSVFEAHQPSSFGDAARFVPVEPLVGAARHHGTEATGAGADVAQDHEGRRTGRPTLAHVRAPGALAHRVELMVVDDVDEVFIGRAVGQLHAEPVGARLPGDSRSGGLNDGQLDETRVAIARWSRRRVTRLFEGDLSGQKGTFICIFRHGKQGLRDWSMMCERQPICARNDPF